MTALAPVASGTDAGAKGAGPPRLVGVPSVRYAVLRDPNGRRYVSLAAVFRTDRALDRHRYATIAGLRLSAGERLPRALFGGVTPSAIGARRRHCYQAEVSQLRRHTAVDARRWRFALRTNGRVVGAPTRVTLKRASGGGWGLAAARRLGC
jgi:hypothetical protein